MLMPQLHIDKAVSTDNDLEYIFPDNYSEYDKLDSILQKLMDQKIDSISKLDSIKNNGQHSNPEVVVDRQIETYRRPRSKKKIKHYRHHRRKDEHQYHQYEQTENSYQNDFMSKKAKWVIIITSCLLIFLCLFLVGITLRMAPLIDELEPTCGPLPSVSTSTTYADEGQETSTGLQQPLIVRTPSTLKSHKGTHFDWNQNEKMISSQKHNLNNLSHLSISNLDRDCFVIPVHSLHRFLPHGIHLPKNASYSDTKDSTGLNVLEISDPKLCILVNLMSPLEHMGMINGTTLNTNSLTKQKLLNIELIKNVEKTNNASTAMLLANMEKNVEFPFISYYVINSSQISPVSFYTNFRNLNGSKFDPQSIRFNGAHTIDVYTEVATIYRPPIHDISNGLTKCHTPYTAYLVSVFKVFEGDDREIFERNWLYWTGARLIYKNLPQCAGLKRIALHKSISQRGDKMYLLMCECSNFLRNFQENSIIIPTLKARLCGNIGLYRPIETF